MAFGPSGHSSHVGNYRPHNEDSYRLDESLGLGVLADGMGGYEGGEIASKIVVDCVYDAVKNGMSVAESLVKAHWQVLSAAKNGHGREGMGSTALVARIDDGDLEVAWVGDSRAYIWHDNNLSQLTTDHSLVQEMIEQGDLTHEEARYHPKRNLITQAIGMSELHRLKVGHIKGQVYPGQKILLCSDGLSEELSADDIADVLSQNLDEQETVDLLMAKALERGGSDNITILLISVA